VVAPVAAERVPRDGRLGLSEVVGDRCDRLAIVSSLPDIRTHLRGDPPGDRRPHLLGVVRAPIATACVPRDGRRSSFEIASDPRDWLAGASPASYLRALLGGDGAFARCLVAGNRDAHHFRIVRALLTASVARDGSPGPPEVASDGRERVAGAPPASYLRALVCRDGYRSGVGVGHGNASRNGSSQSGHVRTAPNISAV